MRAKLEALASEMNVASIELWNQFLMRNVILSDLRLPISESSSGILVTRMNDLNEN
jgi:hypothetical protein